MMGEGRDATGGFRRDRSALRGAAAFVIPFFSDGSVERVRHLEAAVESVFRQTDQRWIAFIVDDASPPPSARDAFAGLAATGKPVRLARMPVNRGPGWCRNVGINLAHEEGCPFVCFLDADDLAHPRRVEWVRALFASDDTLDVVYSGFKVIDEAGAAVADDDLLDGIRTLLVELETKPLSGYDIWIELAATRDTLTIPSSLAVRTSLARNVPFPTRWRIHEDTHTWLRYSASGAKVAYTPRIPSQYRVRRVGGSESRSRSGGVDAFNRLRARVVGDGLEQAILDGIARGVVSQRDAQMIRVRSLLNIADRVARERSLSVAEELRAQAAQHLTDAGLALVDLDALQI